MIAWLVFAVVLFAYVNGANDNFKGVATLFGSRTTDYRNALWWATGTTFAGSCAAVLLSGGLVQAFSGKGLVPDLLTQDPQFLLGVGLGAALVTLASQWGVPVSTTHVSCGSLFGLGTVNQSARWGVVRNILLSWLVTLPLAALCAAAIYRFA